MKQLRGVKALLVAVAVLAAAIGALLAATGLATDAQAEPGDMWTITATAGVNGSIAPAGDVQVMEGASQTFSFYPNSHYHVADVMVDGASVSPTPQNSYTFDNVTGNHTIHVTWGIDPQHTLTYTPGAGGTISGNRDQTVFEGEDGTPVTAIPNTGYRFVSWSPGGSTDAGRTDRNVTEDLAFTANFAKLTYTLAYTAGTGGTITGETPQTVAYNEDGTTVTAKADNGYRFASWSDGHPTASRTETGVTADLSVTANFARVFTLTYTAGTGGTIAGDASQTVDQGGNGTTVTATPNAGYRFVSWSDSASAPASRTDTNVQANLAVTATFELLTYTITPSVDPSRGGTISPSGVQSVSHGGSRTFTIAPRTDYYLADVLVDGDSVGRVKSYPFTNVTESHTIRAVFALGADTSIAPFSAKRTLLDWGQSTLLTGWLFDTSGAQKKGMGGEVVELLSASSIDGPWTSVATLTTSSTAGSVGKVTKLVKLKRPTYFWLRYDPPEDSELAGSDSNYLKVNVRPVLGKPQVPLSVKASKSFTVSGSLKPRFTAGKKTVKVKMYRYRYGRWVYVRAKWAVNYNASWYTQYRTKFSISTKGKYRFRAVTTAWANDTTPLSRTLTVK